MTEMSNPPREIWQKYETVAEETDGMIDIQVLG